MRSFKALVVSFALSFAVAVALPVEDAKAQSSPILPTANKIIYATNSVEVQDSTAKVSYVFKKGTFYVKTAKFSGGSAAIIESHTQRAIWRGPVSAIRIVGVPNNVNSDSLKILSLKLSPF